MSPADHTPSEYFELLLLLLLQTLLSSRIVVAEGLNADLVFWCNEDLRAAGVSHYVVTVQATDAGVQKVLLFHRVLPAVVQQ